MDGSTAGEYGLGCFGICLAALASVPVFAQGTKPIRIIVPFAPAGSSDVLARLLQGPLQQDSRTDRHRREPRRRRHQYRHRRSRARQARRLDAVAHLAAPSSSIRRFTRPSPTTRTKISRRSRRSRSPPIFSPSRRAAGSIRWPTSFRAPRPIRGSSITPAPATAPRRN